MCILHYVKYSSNLKVQEEERNKEEYRGPSWRLQKLAS